MDLLSATICLILCVLVASSSIELRDVHMKMTSEELNYIFSVDSHDQVPDYEIVYLSSYKEMQAHKRGSNGSELDSGLSYSFKAFGQNIDLKLEKNSMLVSKQTKFVSMTKHGETAIPTHPSNCHYISTSSGVVAAISNCKMDDDIEGDVISGIIITQSNPLEISPIPSRLRNGTAANHQIPHVIKVAKFDSNTSFSNDGLEQENNTIPRPLVEADKAEMDEDNIVMSKRSSKLTIELAVFVDLSAYKMYSRYLKSEQAVVNFVLGFINQIQTMFLLPSLTVPIHISVSHLELQKSVPDNSNLDTADAGQLLKLFNDYQKKVSSDMSLLLFGSDMWMTIGGKKSSTVMGLAGVGGVCREKGRGVIAEIGVTNQYGNLYPSAGWNSAYVSAHEMGHNLGMGHDSLKNDCPANGFIMSPSRGTNGETIWSPCSAKVVQDFSSTIKDEKCLGNSPSPSKWDHNNFKNEPGQFWDVHAQCQTLLKNRESWMDPKQFIKDICQHLKCRAMGKYGYYRSGPALTGTFCGDNNWCQAGKCVPAGRTLNAITPNWGPYSSPTECQSGCFKKSKGYQTRIRYCNTPKPMNVEKWCQGGTRKVTFCDDSSLCSKRTSVEDFAVTQCKKAQKYLPDLTSKGRQLPYIQSRPSYFFCAVVCQRKVGSYFAIFERLNNMENLETFFPDGTWCRNDGNQDYYCQNRNCLPEGSRSGKSMPHIKDPLSDVPNGDVDEQRKDAGSDPIQSYLEFFSDPNSGGLVPKVNDISDVALKPQNDAFYVYDMVTILPEN